MFTLNVVKAGSLSLLLLGSPWVFAQATPAQIEKIGTEFTPLGATKAGNANGSIPEWTGGLSQQTNASNPKDGYKDPYAGEKPLVIISKANIEQYKDKLSAGQVAMINRYPDTWKMQVYPTHRSASYPASVYADIKANAASAHLVDDGMGVANTRNAVPFPFPTTGLELVWNHLMRYRGTSVQRTFAGAAPQPNGDYVMSLISEQALFNPDVSDYSKDSGNVLFFYRQTTSAPARNAGQEVLLHEPVNHVKESRKAWGYSAGQRRVRRSPNFAYDTPQSNGIAVNDNSDMFSGAPDRYDWQLVGKKEMYVPYNNYRFASKALKYADIIRPGHVNAELPRYELHRVWHVKGTLKPHMRHIYKQRDLYLDEDSYQILVADQYDNRDVIWRLSESYTINYYDQPLLWTVGDALYDLISGRYTIGNLSNEQAPYQFDIPLQYSDFTPAKLRESGVR
jgi:hypothetical protein